MIEFKYRWARVSIMGAMDLPHIDRMKADAWEQVPHDDPMCPEHNDDAHRTLVLYRKPIELANAAIAETQARGTSRLSDEMERWRASGDNHVDTFAETITVRLPKGERMRRLVGGAGPQATRSEILARLEDFYQPEWFAKSRPKGQKIYGLHGDDALAEANELRRSINLPEWTVTGLRRQLLKHWTSRRGVLFSKNPHYRVGGGPAYAHDKRIEWGMPATFGEWFAVMLRKFQRGE